MPSKVRFEIFRSPVSSWNTLFEEAAKFATSIGRERVINVSHSWEAPDGIVTVWYWSEEAANNPDVEDSDGRT